MKKSVLLRRIILLLLSAVLLSGVLSAGIYILVVQQMYVKMRAEELMPIARTLADVMAQEQAGGADGRGMGPLFERGNRNFLGATLHVYNAWGEPVMGGQGRGAGMGPGGAGPEDFRRGPDGTSAGAILRQLEETSVEAMLQEDLAGALSGKEITGVRKNSDGVSFLVVCVPVASGDAASGAVIFTKPMSELGDALNSLNLTLIMSTLAAFLVMLVPGYLAAKRLAVPIRQMGDVALAMARGDFSKRADEGQKGEIGELGRAMNHFAEESERLEQTRRDYVANVSHELRAPVAAIRAMGETLRDGMAKTPDKRNMFYDNIVRESMRLSRLIDDLLELSRLQSEGEPMEKTVFDLSDVVMNVADMYGPMAAEAGLDFPPPAGLAAPMLVFSNPDQVEQVLVVLLDNAVKHGGAGHGGGIGERGYVTLSAADVGAHVEVRVANTGGSIDDEDLPHIFDRFYKGDKSHSGGGSGLGLSIAREVVSRLGGRIWVERDGSGVQFVFSVGKAPTSTLPPPAPNKNP